MRMVNSEIQKYYWQGFSLQRRLAMPLVILAIAFIIFITNEYQPFSAVKSFAYYGYYIVVFLWGGYQAAHAVVEEVKENTWDNQRLSSISPWQLTIGKLLGSTLYTWYGGLILLALYYFAANMAFSEGYGNYDDPSLMAFTLLGSGLLCQALAMLTSMVPVSMRLRREQMHVAAYFILGLVLSGPFLVIGSEFARQTYRGYESFNATVSWMGLSLQSDYFFMLTLVLAIAWTLVAIYRFMRDALKFQNTPVVWGAFVLFYMVYIGGLANRADMHSNFGFWQWFWNGSLSVAFVLAVCATYVSFFAENLNITRYRALFHYWHQANLHKMAHWIPMWAVSFLLAVVAGVLALFDLTFGYPMFVLSCLLFLVRDACLFHYFTLQPSGRLPTLAALFYLGILYLLVPNIIAGLGVQGLGFWFHPVSDANASLPALLPGIVQALVAVWLVRMRYQKINAAMEATA